MTFKARYRFWHVFGVIFILGGLTTLSSVVSRTQRATEEEGVPHGGIGDFLGFFYFVILFYVSLNLYYALIAANERTRAILRITGMIILVSFLYHLLLFYFLPQALDQEYSSAVYMICTTLKNTLPMLFFSFLFAYVTNMQEALKQRRILEAQKMQLEVEKTQADYKFLKAQINPHFLHNTLNFLYAKSLPYSEDLSEGILTLSDIMRYALRSDNETDGKTPLKDEVEHVRNVIKISQLRFNNELRVNFTVEGNLEGVHIIPFVLITLVENAFKHGELKNPAFPIEIRLQLKDGGLFFYCRNKKKLGPKLLSTGIGLENIKNRLDLTYGAGYRFVVRDEPDFYTTELTIDRL